jgi:tetratricopeptide (TPR) repeat protein
LTNPVRISSQPFQREGPAGAIGEALRAGDFRYAQDLVLAWQRAFPGLPAAHLALGDVHAAQENWAGATKAYRDAANLAFTEATALRLARSLAAMQQMSAAHQALSLYLWQNPQNVVVRLALADLDLEAKNWPRAIVQLEILRDRLGDGDPALLARLGAAWHGAGDDRRAMTYAQAAYQRLPSDPRLRLQLALIAKSVGRQKFAQRLLQAAM